jgi:hypothetical protein
MQGENGAATAHLGTGQVVVPGAETPTGELWLYRGS